MKAASLQAQHSSSRALAAALDEAIGFWQQAEALCEGRARERAQRNLADSRQLRKDVADVQGSGEHCETSHKDAGALQDLARQAIAERRWSDAAVLFRKSAGLWDLATEQCSGAQQSLAEQRREQNEIDAHNAQHCAPAFDQARDFTQRMRGIAAGLDPAERQKQSQAAETLWRDAIERCKGSALDLARGHADTLARERGTPWTSTRLSAPPPPLKTAGTSADAPSPPPATAPMPPVPGAPLAAVGAAAVAGATAVAAEKLAPPFSATASDGTVFSGQISPDPGDQTFSGTGQIKWTNGDIYTGELLYSRRHGQGKIRWASGQSYQGQWVEDLPQGQGVLHFANGDHYEGTVVKGIPEGQGRMAYASGDTFEGRLVAGLPHGSGTFASASGQRTSGLWIRGKATGPGSIRYADRSSYEGDLLNGLPHGTGTMTFASGDSYIGQWQNGQKHGKGVLRWVTGRRWEGEFVNDEQTDGEDLDEPAAAPMDKPLKK